MFKPFQFHYGTIKSPGLPACRGRLYNFNSIMVRLKGQPWVFGTKRDLYFNSIMVRLKEHAKLINAVIRQLFQFHYGTIKREDLFYYDKEKLTFQFHYGTIKREDLTR